MGAFFVPYNGDRLASIDIKGQKILILSTDRFALEDELPLIGADHLEEREENSPAERDSVLSELANEAQSNLVIVPCELSLGDVLNSLQEQFVWIN